MIGEIMKGGCIKHLVQISFAVILILSMMQIKPFGTIVENASAGSSWVQTSDTDFGSGTLENLTINGSGVDAKVELIKDYDIEYTVDGNTVALWHFNEGSDSTAHDESSNYNDGTINGADWVSGIFGEALFFDNVDDHIEVAADSSLNLTNKLTLEAWCKRNSTGTNDYIIDKGAAALNTAYTLSIENSDFARLTLRNSTTTYSYVDSTSTIDTGKWYNIAGTYDGSNLKIYVNGILENTVSWDYNIQINSASLHIGEAKWSSDTNFDGIIDEVRILDVARPPVVLHKGTFTSSIFDTGSGSNFNTITWNPTSQPPSSDLKFQLATNNDGSTWDFVGPGGSSNTYYTTASGQAIWSGHEGDRYLKYKAYLNTTDYSVVPALQDVTIDYNCLPAAPNLLGPPNNEWTNNNTPKFSWVFSDLDGSQSGFQVLIDDDIGFSGVDYNSGEQGSTNTYWQFPEETSYTSMADGPWYWKVRTKDNDDDWGPYSDYRIIKIDTTPPNSFTPTADPSGWTTNVRPVIYFSTTDATSDIDYYNISIDQGAFSTQTSPYTLPSQNDGVHNITVRAFDMAGNYIDGYVEVYIDTIPPIINNKEPIGMDVPLTTTISVTFNEAMNKTLVQDAFSYTDGTTTCYTDGTTTWTATDGLIDWDDNTMTFTPTSYLDYETEYSVTIDNTAEDLAGNDLTSAYTWPFITVTTEGPDTTYPIILGSELAGTDSEVTDTITITFSEPMNHTSVENSTSISPYVPISDFSWDGNNLTITFSSELSQDTEYTLTIGIGAKDQAGTALEEPYTWQFTTKAEPEEEFPLLWLIILLVITVIVVMFVWLLKRGMSKDLPSEKPSGKTKERAEDANTYYERGNALFNHNKFKEAIIEYNKAIKINPKFITAYNDRGTAYYRLKEYDKAISDFDKAIAINPEDPAAFINRAIAYIGTKEIEKAANDFDMTKELNPEFAVHFQELKEKLKMVFICYAREEIDFAKSLSRELEKNDIVTWIDTKITSGEDWVKRIASALEFGNALLFILSESSINSKWVRRELEYADQKGIPIIPIEFAPCELPPWFKFQFGRIQRHLVDKDDLAGSIQSLIDSINKLSKSRNV
jgi:Tfp pilus assembly protein PilF